MRTGNYKRITPKEYENMFYAKYDKNEYELVSEYTKSNEPIKIRHNVCGTIFTKLANACVYERGTCNCPKCSTYYSSVISYVNDIETTHPEVAILMKYEEDKHRYKAHSNEKCTFVCPYYNNDVIQVIDKVTSRGLSCPYCGDSGFSYGEKLFSNIMLQLGIQVKREFSPDWIKPYRYDFMFEYNSIKYIVEIDGGWHFVDNNMSNIPLSKLQEIDLYKQNEAEQHGYIVFRIDANYKDKNKYIYIVSNIKKSPLYNILDMRKVDFQKAQDFASTSSLRNNIIKSWTIDKKCFAEIALDYSITVYTVRKHIQQGCSLGLISCTYAEVLELNKVYSNIWNSNKKYHNSEIVKEWNNGNNSFINISNKLNCAIKTVREHIKKACELNIIQISYEDACKINKDISLKRISIINGQRVFCNETGEYFNSYKEADKKYNSKLSLYFYEPNRSTSGCLPDGTRLSWIKV